MIFTASNNIAYKLRFPAGIPAITKSKCLNQQGAHAFSNVRFIYSWLSSCLPNCNWVVGLPTHRRQVEISVRKSANTPAFFDFWSLWWPFSHDSTFVDLAIFWDGISWLLCNDHYSTYRRYSRIIFT